MTHRLLAHRRPHRWLQLLGLCSAVALLVAQRGPATASACGGPSYATLAGLAPASITAFHVEYPDSDGGWDNARRKELRFLYPFFQRDPVRTRAIWQFAHEPGAPLPAPSGAKLEQALSADDWDAARAHALSLIDDILALPPVPAAAHNALLERALEVVDLHPHLANLPRKPVRDFFDGRNPRSWPAVLQRADNARRGTLPMSASHPRAVTLQWRALRHDFATRVPNGWGGAIRKQVPKREWGRMLSAHDRWLAAHGKHPLRDLVRLDKVRLHYFANTTDKAWALLIDLLPTRPVRALAEMRYLLLRGAPPSDAMLDSLKDPVLIAALAHPERITPKRWQRWWTLSQTAPQAAWSQNLQARLLLVSVRNAQRGQASRGAGVARAVLPHQFPPRALRLTPLWGKLRAAALLQAGRLSAAKQQLALLPADVDSARLLTRAHYRSGDALAAAQVAKLDGETRRYLVEVMLSDAQLIWLSQHGAEEPARLARFERGVRETQRGRWRAAAQLIQHDFPHQARRWRQAAALADRRDNKAALELARLLVEQRASMFNEADNGWYRGVSERHAGIRSPRERRAIASHFRRRSARWRALELLVGWLARNRSHDDARQVLAEADRQYNRLINRGGSDRHFWGRFAKQAPAVKRLRRVGRAIRRQAGQLSPTRVRGAAAAQPRPKRRR